MALASGVVVPTPIDCAYNFVKKRKKETTVKRKIYPDDEQLPLYMVLFHYIRQLIQFDNF
jgi:hypothetical protein